MFLFKSCMDSGNAFLSSCSAEGVIVGVSDAIFVKQKTGIFKCTALLASFGPHAVIKGDKPVALIVNGKQTGLTFGLDQRGKVTPQYLSDQQIKKMKLNFGANQFTFRLEQVQLSAEIHLFSDNDRLLVSDVDGTLTKNDIGGHIHNMVSKNYLHQSYAQLINKVYANGYKIVWLTMRSIALYQYSKTYIRDTVGCEGVLLMEPEEFFPAVKNEVTKQTGGIKSNLMNLIRGLFTSNPFIGGLGNRENDAIAYHKAGVPLEQIFIIDTKSRVQQMDSDRTGLTYGLMAEQIQRYFPKYNAPKVGW